MGVAVAAAVLLRLEVISRPCGGCGPGPVIVIPPEPSLANQNIIDSLVGYPCAQSILGLLPSINLEIKKVLDSTFGIDQTVNIKFKPDTSLIGTLVNGETLRYTMTNGVFTSTIGLNPWMLTHSTKEYIFTTMLHESLHAYMDYNWHLFQTGVLDTAEFKQKFRIFWDYRSTGGVNSTEFAQHEHMTMAYLDKIMRALYSYNPGLSYSTAKNLAWEGLKETSLWFTTYPGDTTLINNFNSMARDTSSNLYALYNLQSCP